MGKTFTFPIILCLVAASELNRFAEAFQKWFLKIKMPVVFLSCFLSIGNGFQELNFNGLSKGVLIEGPQKRVPKTVNQTRFGKVYFANVLQILEF